MNMPSSSRAVRLIDNHAPGRPYVEASVYRDFPARWLAGVEAAWAEAREKAANAATGRMEHVHWDWRNKIDSVERGDHLLVAAVIEFDAQGLMAVQRTPRPAKLSAGSVVYVDYLESAPWNLKEFTPSPRYIGVGVALLAEAVRLSLDLGHGGAIGLHSLPQAEPFYTRRGMACVGPDPDYYDLPYFEYTGQQATAWLARIGVSP